MQGSFFENPATHPPPQSLRETLELIRDRSQTNSERGKNFEKLVRAILLTDPIYADTYDGVWLWDQSPQASRHGPDYGADLILRERKGQKLFAAVQCKFHKEGNEVAKTDIESFVEICRTTEFAYGIIVITSNLTENARRLINQFREKKIEIWTTKTLDQAEIDWTSFDFYETLRDESPKSLTVKQKSSGITPKAPSISTPMREPASQGVMYGIYGIFADQTPAAENRPHDSA